MEFNLRNSVIERCKNTFDLIKTNNPYFSYSIFKSELIKESESILDKIKYRVNLTSKTTDEDMKIGFDNSIDIEHLTQSQINAAYYFLIESIAYLKENNLETKSNVKAPEPELLNNDFKNYKNQNLFKVGLLFARGEMNKYFQVNNLNKIVLNPGYSAPSIAKELNVSVNDKYILAAISNYRNGKNIFNSLAMMNNIIKHCKEENIPIDAYFYKRFVEYKKQY